MYTHTEFAADVEQHFEFLVSEFGMYRSPVHIEGAGAWITYGNALVKVIVEFENGGTCGVSVLNLRHVKVDPMERSEFDLEEIVTVSGPKPQRRRDPRTMSEVIARAAETLKIFGSAVLKGDFEKLHSRQLKFVESLRKNSPAVTN